MRGSHHCRIFPVILLSLAVSLPALAVDSDLVSTMRNVNAVAEAHGFRLNPAYDSAHPMGTGDLAPPQAFEILRPDGKPVSIGRLFTSCVCIQLEAPKRTFEAGERAILQLKNIKPTPLNGQIYAIYVQITSPIRTTLRFDTFVQSQSVILPDPAAAIAEQKEKAEAVDDKAEAEQKDKPEETKTAEAKTPEAEIKSGDAKAGGIEVIELAKPVTDQIAQAAAMTGQKADREKAEAPSLDNAKAEMEAFFREKADEAGAAADSAAAAPDDNAEIGEYRENDTGAPAAPASAARAAEAEKTQPARPERAAPAAASAKQGPERAVSLITIGVRDMGRSIRFYEELGWRRASRNKYDQTAFFQLRGQVLALYPLPELLKEQNMEKAMPSPGGITLAIHVGSREEVPSLYKKFVDAGGTSLREPTGMPSGAVTSYVADPDGNPWEISWVPQFRVDEEGGLWLP